MFGTRIQIDWMEVESGKLGMCRCPGVRSPWSGKSCDLDADMRDLKFVGVTDAIVLLPADEISMYSPSLMFAYQRSQIETVHFPIENMSVPQNLDSFQHLVKQITGLIEKGRFPVIHCMAGKGRAGTVFACVLRALGHSSEEAMSLTRKIRPGTIQSLSQELFVSHFQI